MDVSKEKYSVSQLPSDADISQDNSNPSDGPPESSDVVEDATNTSTVDSHTATSESGDVEKVSISKQEEVAVAPDEPTESGNVENFSINKHEEAADVPTETSSDTGKDASESSTEHPNTKLTKRELKALKKKGAKIKKKTKTEKVAATTSTKGSQNSSKSSKQKVTVSSKSTEKASLGNNSASDAESESWDSKFDDDGECLEEDLMKEVCNLF